MLGAHLFAAVAALLSILHFIHLITTLANILCLAEVIHVRETLSRLVTRLVHNFLDFLMVLLDK